ncbi:hypothetical protein A0H76_1603 [Hepatospora eriocheir]|uniref:Uncharacterized protein n=1 Tax=Hepatospora eriocheir TaxID=1081669 RepID=A0A1X0QGV1_9MICR|nr:hypothetical protein A0H76_1603 [Hepatospora eriocheir]
MQNNLNKFCLLFMQKQYKKILNEIRIDWETLLTDEFNPLHIALAVNKGTIQNAEFREMFHKLEFIMEKIIEVNFKGFSDSVLSYNEYNKQNAEIIEILNESFEASHQVEGNLYIDTISKENKKSEYFKARYEILRELKHIKIMFDEYLNSTEIIKRCNQLVRCLDLIDNKELLKIKGVYEFRLKIYKEYVVLSEEVCMEVFKFIFNNEINVSFKCCLILGNLHELEVYFYKNFKTFLFNKLESIIINVSKSTDISLETLCKLICNKIDRIILNHQTIVDCVLKNFKLDKNKEDYFGNKDESYSYVTRSDLIISTIEAELMNFIDRYSITIKTQGEFNLENIVDNIDYTKIYPTNYNIYRNDTEMSVEESSKAINKSYGTYTLILSPKYEIVPVLLKFVKNAKIRVFLNKKVETVYTKFRLEKNLNKVEELFKESAKINTKNSKLVIYESLKNIIDSIKDNSSDSEALKKQIMKKSKEYFQKLYEELFKCKIVTKRYETIQVYNGKRGMITEFDPAFREALSKTILTKGDTFLVKQNYLTALYAFNTIKDLDNKLSIKETNKLYEKWLYTLRRQLNVEFFYQFDIYFREGHYDSNFYFKKITDVLNLFYSETKMNNLFDDLYKNIEYYCKVNAGIMKVFNEEDLIKFIKELKIFDEVMGEINFGGDLNELYSFYNQILKGESKDKEGMKLQKN